MTLSCIYTCLTLPLLNNPFPPEKQLNVKNCNVPSKYLDQSNQKNTSFFSKVCNYIPKTYTAQGPG